MADRAPAPGRLALVQAFENTVDLERGEEELLSPEALAGWLARRGLLGPGERLSQADLERALAAREAVRALLLANGGAPADPEAADALDRLGAAARLRVRFDADGHARLVPDATGVDGALGELLAIIDGAMRDGTWTRLKACREDTCRWAYYDHSKNRSGTWCTMAACGNRAKARSYRQRKGHSSRGAREDGASAPAGSGGGAAVPADPADQWR